MDHETTGVGAGVHATPACFIGGTAGIYWNNPDPDEGSLLDKGSFATWQATGISDSGGIVGSVFDPGPDSAAYWPDVTAAPVDIGSIVDGNGASYAQRINNRNPATEVIAAVGWNTDSIGVALLWECTGNCSDPLMNNWSFEILDQILSTNCTDWDLRRAYDVKDETRIIGWGRKFGQPNTENAVILVPLEFCCIADLDGNGTVSTNDLLILFANWGPCPVSHGPCCADLNSDGTVNTEDLLILQANWGPCGGESAGGGGGGSPSLQAAVQQLGFPSVAAHQAWLAQAGEMEAYVSTYVLITILQDQE
ncbi:MAG: hypothetical protein IH984_13740 [Planctomycetes bacterium]|nr:hypothetical protein [Planctomycetota bacterium]